MNELLTQCDKLRNDIIKLEYLLDMTRDDLYALMEQILDKNEKETDELLRKSISK